MVENTNWNDLVDLTNIVTPAVNDEVFKWGVKVESVSFPDLGEIKTYRIIGDANQKGVIQTVTGIE